jgi:DNA topoisomerase-3
VILQQEIAREQMAKLLSEGRTDLLPNFKSSRTGRNFKAFLVKQPDGKIGFEFEKKEPKAAAAKKAPAKATAKATDDTEEAAPAKVAKVAKVAAKAAPARKTAARKTPTRKTGS